MKYTQEKLKELIKKGYRLVGATCDKCGATHNILTRDVTPEFYCEKKICGHLNIAFYKNPDHGNTAHEVGTALTDILTGVELGISMWKDDKCLLENQITIKTLEG